MISSTSFLVLCLSVFAVNSSVLKHNPFYCYSQDPIRPQVGMFATKSTYETNRGQNIDPTVSSCSPSKFWLLSRHGTRLPSKTDLGKMFEHNERIHRGILKNYDEGRTSLCASDIELIRSWKFDSNITLDKEQYLTVAGWNELQGLAQRYQAAFPSVLSTNYSTRDYFFRSTHKQRTRASLKAFADGLFGFNGFERVQFEEVPEVDFLLRPHDNCPLYDEVIDTPVEQNAFVDGPEYEQMLSEVSAKLGFLGSKALSAVEVETLASICKYEQIWNINGTSPLCAAFSIANHQVLEYYEDLDYYWRVGYGYSNFRALFENMNCHLMQDMLNFLESNNPTDHKARIFSTHSTILQLILVTFGAFEDATPLTRHNFAQQTLRLWKSSLVAPMGTNLAVIRYE
jgi:multiple inositol-polyphosphate phosphatase / 2,3-bisphosphoglycerate 3-phosphatase